MVKSSLVQNPINLRPSAISRTTTHPGKCFFFENALEGHYGAEALTYSAAVIAVKYFQRIFCGYNWANLNKIGVVRCERMRILFLCAAILRSIVPGQRRSLTIILSRVENQRKVSIKLHLMTRPTEISPIFGPLINWSDAIRIIRWPLENYN